MCNWRASLVYWTGGLDSTSMLVMAGAAAICLTGAEDSIAVGTPADATLPVTPVLAVPVPPGRPAEATLPTMPALEPDLTPLPMPVEPTTPGRVPGGPRDALAIPPVSDGSCALAGASG